MTQIEENEFSNIAETKNHLQQSVEKGMLQISQRTHRMSHEYDINNEEEKPYDLDDEEGKEQGLPPNAKRYFVPVSTTVDIKMIQMTENQVTVQDIEQYSNNKSK